MAGYTNIGVRLAIVATHPIQYHVPWFQALNKVKGLCVKVFYGFIPDARQQGEGFGISFTWDVPLLKNYNWELCENVSHRPSVGKFSGISTPNLEVALEKYNPHLVIVTGWQSKMLVQAVFKANRLRIPVVVRGESNLLQPRPMWKKTLHRLWLKRFDAFLTIGRANREYYRSFGIEEQKQFRCPYFVDNQFFYTKAEDFNRQKENLRQRWSVPRDSMCFVFVGKLIAKKRVMDFVEAIASINKVSNSIYGLVVGSGEKMSVAQSFVDTNNLPVRFTGFLNQSEISAAYSAVDCLVLPSDHGETWGLVVNEAMACGIPAIVSDKVGCGPDLIQQGKTGAIFPCGNVNALSNIMEACASDPNGLKFMGENAKKLVTSEYSVQRATEGVKAALSYVLEKRGFHCSF